MKYCQNCGNPIRSQGSFCPVCKAAYAPETPGYVKKEQNSLDPMGGTVLKKAKKSGKTNRTFLLVIGIAAAVLLILCALLLILWPTVGGSDSPIASGWGKNPHSEDGQILLDETKISLIVGQSAKLQADTTGIDPNAKIHWSAEDTDIVRMDGRTIIARSPGKTTVTASAEGASAQCEVTVIARKVEGIEIDKRSAKTSYYVDDAIQNGDVLLLVTYNDGKTESKTSGFDLDYDFSKPGTTELTVRYEGKSDSISVTVEQILLEKLELVKPPADTALMEKETLNPSGMVLKAYFSNGTDRTITDNFTCHPTTFPTAGTHAVTVSYGEKSVQFNVTVTALPRYTVSATSSNGSYGTVSASASGPFLSGETVTLTASPKSGCIFEKWSDGNTSTTRTVTVSKDASYTAIFYGPESDWEDSIPSGAKKTDERTVYSFKDTKVTDGTHPGGNYKLVSDKWVARSSGSVYYVPNLPSGIKRSGSEYNQYCGTKQTGYEKATEKLVIDSDSHVGYLYYHYCRGDYSKGPINRQAANIQTGEFTAYHVYYDTSDPAAYGSRCTDRCGHNPACDGSGSYGRYADWVCRDSYWYYFAKVYQQTYTIYDRQATYELSIEQTTDPGGNATAHTQYKYRPK